MNKLLIATLMLSIASFSMVILQDSEIKQLREKLSVTPTSNQIHTQNNEENHLSIRTSSNAKTSDEGALCVPVTVYTPDAPAAIGPYVQAKAISSDCDLLFLSGQIGLDPRTQALVSDNVSAQAKQVMQNLLAVLEAAGTNFDSVVKSLIFLDDIANFDAVNSVYAGYFSPDNKPARSTVGVKQLPKGAKVEIECIAIVQKKNRN